MPRQKGGGASASRPAGCTTQPLSTHPHTLEDTTQPPSHPSTHTPMGASTHSTHRLKCWAGRRLPVYLSRLHHCLGSGWSCRCLNPDSKCQTIQRGALGKITTWKTHSRGETSRRCAQKYASIT